MCFSENFDKQTGKKIDKYFIPASFRVGDNSVKKSVECSFVKYIFLKKNKNLNYHNLCYGNESYINDLPEEIKNKLDFTRLISNKETA